MGVISCCKNEIKLCKANLLLPSCMCRLTPDSYPLNIAQSFFLFCSALQDSRKPEYAGLVTGTVPFVTVPGGLINQLWKIFQNSLLTLLFKNEQWTFLDPRKTSIFSGTWSLRTFSWTAMAIWRSQILGLQRCWQPLVCMYLYTKRRIDENHLFSERFFQLVDQV